MAFWQRRADGSIVPKDETLEDIEFKPKEFEEKITTSFKTELEALKAAQEESMKPVSEMLAALKAEREAKEEAARKAAENKNKENDEVTDEDWMLDPAGTTRKLLKPQAQATMMLAARMAKQDTLGEKEYYYGELKNKIDSMIATLPLVQQSNPASLENCYKIVMWDHQKDITEGKIKARNSSASFESNGTGGHSGKEGGIENETLTEDEKRAARAFNLTDKQWIESRKEMTYV